MMEATTALHSRVKSAICRWTAPDEPRPKKPKGQTSEGKVRMFTEFCSLTNSQKEKRSIDIIESIGRRSQTKTAPYGKEKTTVPPRQYTVSQINGQIE